MELILEDTQGVLTVPETTFKCDFNEALVHQVLVTYVTNSRQGTRSQKSRAQVAGSGKKPWRQKGTGRARAGSTKSPIWRSGGVTFAATPQEYDKKVNKKMYRGALRSIFSELIRQNRLVVVENFHMESPRTKLLIQKLKEMTLDNVLIIISQPNLNENLFLAARNLNRVSVQSVSNVDPNSLVSSRKALITVSAIKRIEEILA